MSDLISKEALIKKFSTSPQTIPTDVVLGLITNAPAIEQGEVAANGHYAIYYQDNWDGEADKYWMFAFIENGVWHGTDTHNELLQYEGDAILKIVPLSAPTPQQPQSVADALEEAARICEYMQKKEDDLHIGQSCMSGTTQIRGKTFAEAIRALIKRNAELGPYSNSDITDDNLDEELESLCEIVGINPKNYENTLNSLPDGFYEYPSIGRDNEKQGFSCWIKSKVLPNKGSDFTQAFDVGLIAFEFGNCFLVFKFETVI